MPLGEFFSCVWLVLLALILMTTFPRYFYCSCSFTPSSSSSVSSSSSTIKKPSQPEHHSATAAATADAAAAAISTSLCHNSIDTSDLISTNCEQPLRQQQEPRMRITGEINEGPGPPSCPSSCSSAHTQAASEKNSSCYRYLVQKDCEEPWLNDWSEIRLRHCCEHSIREAVPDADLVLSDREQCSRHVNELLELDLFVAKVTCQFRHVLLRYDCLQKYSVNDCGTCREAYRRWVCASLIPHWRQRHKIKPCRSICHTVEQTCPWFLPADKNPGYPAQYAGEPIFQCIDTNIPETGEQLLKSTYGSGCCYEYCEQRRNIEVPTTSSYHRLDKSKFPHTRIVSCLQGCNDSENDPSHENTKSPASSAPCHNARSTSATSAPTRNAGETKKNGDAVPFVNFALSSCPSSHSSSQAAAADATHAGTGANRFSSTQLTLWLLGSTLIALIRQYGGLSLAGGGSR